MYPCKFGGENSTDSEDRAQKRLILQFFKDGDIENEVTLKIRSRSQKSYQLFIRHNDTIHRVKLESIVSSTFHCISLVVDFYRILAFVNILI